MSAPGRDQVGAFQVLGTAPEHQRLAGRVGVERPRRLCASSDLQPPTSFYRVVIFKRKKVAERKTQTSGPWLVIGGFEFPT